MTDQKTEKKQSKVVEYIKDHEYELVSLGFAAIYCGAFIYIGYNVGKAVGYRRGTNDMATIVDALFTLMEHGAMPVDHIA